jgi:hypothetical protein
MEEMQAFDKKIKIVKCSYDTFWYKDLVGQTLTFEDYSPRDYYVRTRDGILRSILVNDVEFVDKKSPLI